jgi:hypothetical protein
MAEHGKPSLNIPAFNESRTVGCGGQVSMFNLVSFLGQKSFHDRRKKIYFFVDVGIVITYRRK